MMLKTNEIAGVCLEKGWRCTAQRIAIYHFIVGNLTHPGVDEVWNEVRKTLPTVTRGSVYRILNEFAEADIIQRLDHIENARYDCNAKPHGHFICEKCNEIMDFALPDGYAPPPLGDIELKHIELRTSGICHKCRQKTITKE